MCEGFGGFYHKSGKVYFCEPDSEGDCSHRKTTLRLPKGIDESDLVPFQIPDWKKKLKNKSGYYNMSDERAQARRKVIKSMEGSNLLDRIEQAFKDIVPIIILISRLVASLILAILSLDRIKVSISPQTLAKLNRVYKMAVSIS